MNSKPCEWCDKDTTIVCSQCREIHLCSKACMKLIWKEHKRTCERVEQASSAVDALTDDLRELIVETEGQTHWWLNHRDIHGRGEPVPHGCCHGGQGRKEGVAEGAEESGVCGAQQVASLLFREQVQGAEVVPAASHHAAGLPARPTNSAIRPAT